MNTSPVLTTTRHDRDSAGLTYVYPVISRRAGGVSVGINLNPNNACNWRCIYCQVPGLKRGTAPKIDLALLESELTGFLDEVVHGHFMAERVPPEARRLNDIALSGNGEPTSAREFPEVIEMIGRVMARFDLVGKIKLVLITNGSLIQREPVQRGIARMGQLNGEVWFKLDAIDRERARIVNGAAPTLARVRENLRRSAALCPTWIQTCVFALDAQGPSEAERQAYVRFLGDLVSEGVMLKGVLLYGLARQPMQPGADRLGAVNAACMEDLAADIKALNLDVRLSASS